MPTPITASTLSALLATALAQKPTRPLVLALDGRCGSGKTTLANGLAAQLPSCTLLRTDDFYLPPAQPLVILEGSYSHHPLLRPYETLRVFVTCAKPEQTRRLQAREGARYADFAARWVPLEEGYFAQYGVAESADFVVDTTGSGMI